MAKYAKTWWGEQWLNSLAHIDYSNRLPRGRSYANKGAVREIGINGNTIAAKVTGSRPTPYKVVVTVPRFDARSEEKLVDAISREPALISKLLNRELDPQLLKIAESVGIQVFPKRWDDLTMSCSCPDWAVPCKHLAATIYKICNEIDNDPFLVFSLHGIDLVKALKSKDISIETQNEAACPSITDLLRPLVTAKSKKTAAAPVPDAPNINFAAIPDVLQPLAGILPDNPSFSLKGNFRDVYLKVLRRVAREANNLLEGKTNYETAFLRYRNYLPEKSKPQPEVSVSLTPDDSLALHCNGTYDWEVALSGKPVEMKDLCRALYGLAPAALPDFSPAVVVLHQVHLFALNLLRKGVVVPQLFADNKKHCHIRWIPASPEKTVKGMLAQFLDTPGLLFYKEKGAEQACAGDIASLCSLFLDFYIRAWGEAEKDRIAELFFAGAGDAFGGVGETNIPKGITAWLNRFNITHKQYVPLLQIGETKSGGFTMDISIEDRSNAALLPVPLADILGRKKYEKNRYAILQDTALLSGLVDGLDGYINSGAHEPLTMNPGAFAVFLFEHLPVIRLLDINAIMPKALQEIFRPKASVRITKKQKDGKSFVRLDDLLAFDWQVALGDECIGADEFLKLIKQYTGILKFRNQYIYLDPKELEKLQKALQQPLKMSAMDLLRTALSEEYQGAPIVMDAEVRKLMKQLTEQKDMPLPGGLNATLRPYQLRGYSWLLRNTRIGFGSLIADDMGLGKTLQVIALLLRYKEEGWLDGKPVLTVVPTSLLTNWTKELERFAPGLKYEVYHGGTRSLNIEGADVLLTTYGTVRSDNDLLKKQQWFAVVTDEAQNIKNTDTAQTKAVKAIAAEVHIAMSGTPVENRLSEYWSIMDFANKGLLGNAASFIKDFARPIQQENDTAALEKFRRITAPFLLRRLKSDKSIIADLPDKVEQDRYCTLTPAQASLYESTLKAAMKEIEGAGSDKESMFKRQGLVLQMIMALKQICNHPAQFLKNKKHAVDASGKALLLMDMLETIHETHEKALIFTQYTEMGGMLSQFIAERFGRQPLFLHGAQTRKQRDEMVQRFQNERPDRFFILSLKAGGTGLNLTAAQNVLHYDLWWNPAVEAQATDRAYRIGQQSNVMVYRFITKGTFEERINEMIQEKKALANLSVGVGENWIGNMSNKELKEVFRLR